MQIDFRFSVGQKVTTPFGEVGIVRMVAADSEGKQYSVLTKQGQPWFLEKELSESAKEV
jgi:hypothetical protein